jgi:hypothetical protein
VVEKGDVLWGIKAAEGYFAPRIWTIMSPFRFGEERELPVLEYTTRQRRG